MTTAAPGPASYTTACSRADIDRLVDAIAFRPAVRAALKLKLTFFLALSTRGPSPAAQAKLQELIEELLRRANDATDPEQRDRIEALIGLLFCVLGERPPTLDLNQGKAAIVTPDAGATLALPCVIECAEAESNVAGVIIPPNALPSGTRFVLVSLLPTQDTLPTSLPRREPTFRVSLSPDVRLTRPAVIGACVNAANLPVEGELVLARGIGPGEPITPGNERDGELEIARVQASQEDAAALALDCEPEAPTALGRALELLLPRPLHASRWLFGRGFRAAAAPAGTWGGVVVLPRTRILTVAPTSASFSVLVGGVAPAPVTIAVTNTGIETAITDLAVGTITYGPGASGWLNATLASPIANTMLTLQANPSGLGAGVYTATVPVTTAQAPNSPQTIAVTLRVAGIPSIGLAATTAGFSAVAGERDPAPVSIAMTNTGQGTLDGLLVSAPTYGAGATGWLTATLTSAAAPSSLALTARTATLPPGVYTATVTITAPDAPNSPQTVTVTLTMTTRRFRTVSAGQGDFACGISPSGQAYCWGDNQHGQLGDGTTTARLRPTPVLQPDGVTFAQITAGGSHTCALTDAGRAYCWGLGSVGQLGSGQLSQPFAVLTPRAVGTGFSFVSIAAVANATCALTAAGQAYCWGFNTEGAIGNGNTQNTGAFYFPVPVLQPAGVTFRSLSAGLGTFCGVTSSGQAYCWGRNGSSQIGDGTTVNRFSPTPVLQPAGVELVEADPGTEHTCALTGAGGAYCWGRNGNGSFGTGESAGAYPTPVSAATSGGPWQLLRPGGDTTCGINLAGRVLCWGTAQRLGTGSAAGSSVPVDVLLPAGMRFVRLSSERNFSCAISEQDELFCWGLNSSGQLGDGTTTDRFTPVRVE